MKRFNDFQLDSANECLWREGNRLPLTPKAFAILNCLVENADRIVTKDEFMESVWPGVYVGEENLKVYIRELRGLLGDHAANPRYIETSRDRGYRFIARVTERPAPTEVQSLLSGRAAELNVLNEALRRASQGDRQCLLVTGEPGIGKTSLVENFLLNTSQDFPLRVCIGQCIESYREQEAFYPVLEAFGRLLHEHTGDELSEMLARYAPTWLAQFPSALTTTARDLLQSQIVGANRDRMLREICQALEAITAKTPLVFVLEDLHWSDHSTLDFIAALARRPEPARLLLIATYRPVEVILSRHPLRQLKSELCLHGQASEVALELLDKSAIAEILKKRFSASIAAELSEGVYEKTDGNPLFVVALMDHLVQQNMIVEDDGNWRLKSQREAWRSIVPHSLLEIIRAQIDQLAPEDEELLMAASVAGRVFAARIIADALSLDETTVEERCDSLVTRRQFLNRAGLLDLPNGQVCGLFEFTHALFSDAFYNHASPVARLRLHKRIGNTIEEIWKGREYDVAAELTRHFQGCRDYQRALKYLQLQAENDEHRYAYRDAVDLLESALEVVKYLPPDLQNPAKLEITSHLARIYDKLGDKVRAIELYQSSADQAAAAHLMVIAAQSLLFISRLLAFTDPAKAIAVAEQAIQMAAEPSALPFQHAAAAWVLFLKLIWEQFDPDVAVALKESLDKLWHAGDLDLYSQQAFVWAVIQVYTGEYESALVTTRQVLPALTRNGDSVGHFSTNWMQSWALWDTGRLQEALNGMREAIALPQRNMNAFDTALGQMFLAQFYCDAFDPVGARALSDEALPILLKSQSMFAIQRGLIVSAFAHLGCGDLDKANECLSEMRRMHDTSKVGLFWYWRMPLHFALGEYHLARQEYAKARAEVDQLKVASANINLGWCVRGMELSARLALAENEVSQAQFEITEACTTIEGQNLPLIACCVHDTAASLFKIIGSQMVSKDHTDQRNQVLSALAMSLPEAEPLRKTIQQAIHS